MRALTLHRRYITILITESDVEMSYQPVRALTRLVQLLIHPKALRRNELPAREGIDTTMITPFSVFTFFL